MLYDDVVFTIHINRVVIYIYIYIYIYKRRICVRDRTRNLGSLFFHWLRSTWLWPPVARGA